MNFRQRTPTTTYLPEESPPPAANIIFGLQHVLSMFGATFLAPVLMGFDPSVAILFSGIATIIFYVITRGKVPSYLGSSFAFIGPVIALTAYSGTGPNQNIPIALGGIIVCGIVYFVSGLLIKLFGTKLLSYIFPPAVTGTIVLIIGMSLAQVAVNQVGRSPVNVSIAAITILFTVLAAVYGGLWIRRFSIIFGLFIGILTYWASTIVGLQEAATDFSRIHSAAWFGFPQFVNPIFTMEAAYALGPIAIILIAENLGHIKAIEGMIGRSLDSSVGDAFIADGLATALSASLGGTGVTTYAENMGVMRVTQNFSSFTMVVAGAFAIVLGFVPKFGALIGLIPSPVIGGLSFVLFGLISATAAAIWQQARDSSQVDMDRTSSLFIVGVPTIIAAGGMKLAIGTVVLDSIVLATFAAVGLGLVMRSDQKASSDQILQDMPYPSKDTEPARQPEEL